MWEVKRIGRQWQIWKDGEFFCLPSNNTKRTAEFEMTKRVFAIAENEAFENERRAARLEKANSLRDERASKATAQAELF